MIQENIKVNLTRGTDVLVKAAGIAAAIVSIGAGYFFFISYIYKPKVEVVSVDYSIGKAVIKILGIFPRIIDLEGDTTYQIMGDWGIKLGTTLVEDTGNPKYDRIELTRKGMVVEYLKKVDK
jgi:hypothetical protein